MSRSSLPATLGVALLVAGVGPSAAANRSPFPLADGNRWTLRDTETAARATISVRGSTLLGLPGAGPLRVRRQGSTVQAWDAEQRRWETLFRLDAPEGTRHTVDLAGTALWRSLTVTVASKREVVHTLAGRTLRGCVRLTFRSGKPIADAGLEELVLAPGVGPVRLSEQTIAGTRRLVLASYSLRS